MLGDPAAGVAGEVAGVAADEVAGVGAREMAAEVAGKAAEMGTILLARRRPPSAPQDPYPPRGPATGGSPPPLELS